MPQTKGPWRFSKSGLDRTVYAEHESAFDLAIVRNAGSDPETDANARLIVAAPDMLAAAQDVLDWMDNMVERKGIAPGWLAIENRLRAAVAKVKGE